ncbi:hypothetical protein CLI64_18895 [Nostoc sp. CENA543]|nr:hypothetical protein CLI64_18895 [Nostoc sp. CENA543]
MMGEEVEGRGQRAGGEKLMTNDYVSLMTSPQPLSDAERGLNIFKGQRKIKVFKPLSLQGRGLERGF